MEIVLLVLGIGVIAVALLFFNKERKNTKKRISTNDMKELETIIDNSFLELQEENHKQQQAYLSDINYLHKKVNTLEAKFTMLEKYKKIDIKVESLDNDISIIKDAEKDNDFDKNQKKELLTIHESSIDGFNPIINEDTNKSIHKQVIQLYVHGYTVEVIAKKLNIMCGEVQLMIGLYKKNKE